MILVELLATARLTRLATEDTITQPIRDWAMSNNPKLSDLLSCRACSSMWAAAVVLGMSQTFPAINRMLALSESVILMRELGNGD